MRYPARIRALGLMVGLGFATVASLVTAQRPFASPVHQGCGVQHLDGELWGVGPDYKVRFGTDGVEFVPALGARAPGNLPLRFTLESVRRTSAARGTPLDAPNLSFDDRMVRYARDGTGFVETYDVRPDGVEQTFTFTSLPPGHGDLVVRGRITTELPLGPGAARDGLTFQLDGIGGVRVGAVTGIDRDGATTTGSILWADGAIELVLPAAFVDRAALPLVLDPLIGSVIDVSVTTGDDLDPDVAYDATVGTYLVVWEREFSATDVDVVAQRVRPDGTLFGGAFAITATTTRSENARVADVNLRDRFVVVWQENDDVLARSVPAGGAGGLGPLATLASGPDVQIVPDVGGEATTVDDDVVAVWMNLTRNRIEARQVQVNVDGTLSRSGVVTITSGSQQDGTPAISQSAGPGGRFLIAWMREFPTGTDIRGTVIDRNLVPLAAEFSIAVTSRDEDDPAVDGDGTNWLVAFETAANPTATDHDIGAVTVSYDPSTGRATRSLPIVVVDSPIDLDDKDPAVAWLGDSYLIAWADQPPGFTDYDLAAMSVDPATCSPCEGGYVLVQDTRLQGQPAIATRKSGDPAEPEEALVAWQSIQIQNGDIRAHRVGATDGLVIDLGGGCGSGGEAVATCVRYANFEFQIRLQRASPSSQAFLLLGIDRLDARCGTCRLVPDPFTGFLFGPIAIDTDGLAFQAIPIPPMIRLVGARVFAQWLVVPASGTPVCTPLGADLSGALTIEIQR